MVPRVSIIIPVYNAEQFLAQNIESILAQTSGDWQLILVDDGSTDTSLAICQQYAEKDERIRVISKPNGGVSSARNAALEVAIGEWVMFIDADDSLTANALEICNAYADKGYDMVRFAIADVLADGSIRKRRLRSAHSKSQFIRQVVGHHTVVSVCATLFHRSLFENPAIRFDHNVRYGEDWLVLAQVALKARRIKLLPSKRCYLYNCTNEQSCTNTFGLEKHIAALETVELLREIVGDKYRKELSFARCRLTYTMLKQYGFEQCGQLLVANSNRVVPLDMNDIRLARNLRPRRKVRLARLVKKHIK